MTVILCDFDGTLTETETMDIIYEQFAACGTKYAERWVRAEISTLVEIVSSFRTITATRLVMEKRLADIELIPGAIEFVQACWQKKQTFAIVSDGLRWYIEFVLEQHGLWDLKIYTNEIFFQDGRFLFSWPWYHPSTPLRGTSKSNIIRMLQQHGEEVVFIGNGHSDTDVVGVADRIYARGFLAEYCENKGVTATVFTDFHDLIRYFPHL